MDCAEQIGKALGFVWRITYRAVLLSFLIIMKTARLILDELIKVLDKAIH